MPCVVRRGALLFCRLPGFGLPAASPRLPPLPTDARQLRSVLLAFWLFGFFGFLHLGLAPSSRLSEGGCCFQQGGFIQVLASVAGLAAPLPAGLLRLGLGLQLRRLCARPTGAHRAFGPKGGFSSGAFCALPAQKLRARAYPRASRAGGAQCGKNYARSAYSIYAGSCLPLSPLAHATRANVAPRSCKALFAFFEICTLPGAITTKKTQFSAVLHDNRTGYGRFFVNSQRKKPFHAFSGQQFNQ